VRTSDLRTGCCAKPYDEALAWAQRARALDPLGISGVTNGWILFHARRYDEAIQELRSVLAVHPDYAYAQFMLGFALIGNANPRNDSRARENGFDNAPQSRLRRVAGDCIRARRRRTEALRLINRKLKRRRDSYIRLALFIKPYMGLGDYEQAFAWFERAYQEKSNILQFLKVHPFFDPVRGDPVLRTCSTASDLTGSLAHVF